MGTWINDLRNNIVLANDANTLAAAARTTTANGASVDLVESEGNCFAVLNLGAVSGTTPTLDVKFQDGDTSGGAFTDIPGASFVQLTTQNKSLALNFKRTRRFVRAVATIAGTTPSFTFSVVVFGMKKAS